MPVNVLCRRRSTEGSKLCVGWYIKVNFVYLPDHFMWTFVAPSSFSEPVQHSINSSHAISFKWNFEHLQQFFLMKMCLEMLSVKCRSLGWRGRCTTVFIMTFTNHYNGDTWASGRQNHWTLNCCWTVCSGYHKRKHQSSALPWLCDGNPPVTDEFLSKLTSNVESISMSWRHHVFKQGHPFSSVVCWQIPSAEIIDVMYYCVEISPRKWIHS